MEYLYTLVNEYNNVEYVGITRVPKQRLRQHTRVKPSTTKSGHGKFYGRDMSLEVVASYNTREEALLAEGRLKKELGMEWTEKSMHSKGGKTQGKIKYTCPHCGKKGTGNAMKQHHFDNCKNKD